MKPIALIVAFVAALGYASSAAAQSTQQTDNGTTTHCTAYVSKGANGKAVINVIFPKGFEKVVVKKVFADGMATGSVIKPLNLTPRIGQFIEFSVEQMHNATEPQDIYGFRVEKAVVLSTKIKKAVCTQ